MRFILIIGLLPALALADVTPHALFSENAVLQQEMRVPVWGTAGEGEEVTVEFEGQKVSTAAKDGRWMVVLEPLKAGGPFAMVIRGKNTVTLNNVAVGEVWVCAGQSNMGMGLGEWEGHKEIEAKATDPMLRFFQQPVRSSHEPERDVKAAWQASTPYWAHMFSAVGYFMGRDLRAARKVPVGLIQAAYGGTYIEKWTPRAYLEADEKLRPKLEQYPQILKRYEEAVAKAKADGTTPPANPEDDGRMRTCGIYNGMIAPIQPYAIRGAAWYQGENDSDHGFLYRKMLPLMIKSWRETWVAPGTGNVVRDFPFLIVQLAPYWDDACCNENDYAELREAQLLTARTVPNTAVIVTTDTGDDLKNLHPRLKEPIGARLALAARALAYEEKIEYSGPMYESVKIEGDRVTLSFSHVGGGLVAADGPLKGFTIAGEDRKFVPAVAEIVGDTVVVHSEAVKQPAAVRYGWAFYPRVNLFNKAGLPASPFRTDSFPIISEQRQ